MASVCKELSSCFTSKAAVGVDEMKEKHEREEKKKDQEGEEELGPRKCTTPRKPLASRADIFENILLMTDSYKVSHYRQYPPNTAYVYSYFESRGGKFSEVCFFGLQYFIKRYLEGVVVTKEKIDEAEVIVNQHMGGPHFNRAGWEHILHKCGGKLPVSIMAVPEGTIVPTKNVLFTMVNTDPVCYWLTNYLETLLVQVWYPMTVATSSREQKKIIASYFDSTGCPRSEGSPELAFKLHDFGYRGVSSVEYAMRVPCPLCLRHDLPPHTQLHGTQASVVVARIARLVSVIDASDDSPRDHMRCFRSAGLGGAAHLINFMGTDTLAGILLAKRFYLEKGMPGFSIPAAEHSTITSWGRERELDAFRNMLTSYPTGLVAVVSDSYNIYDACEKLWGTELKQMILDRDGTLVVRPDSGEPKVIVVEVLKILTERFGCTTNQKGFRMLPPQIRVIQGDGISYESLGEILQAMQDAGFAADNLAFGSGGALLQKVNRDTQKIAFKCSEITDNKGKTTLVYKDPISDHGKMSKKGRLTLEKDSTGKVVTKTEGRGDPMKDMLVEVFRDGKMMKEYNFAEIRKRAQI